MEKSPPRFKKYIFVCENSRDPSVRESCGPRGGTQIFDKLKAAVKERGLEGQIRVSRTGCLDICAMGPNVLIYPDTISYKFVKPGDVDEIIREQIEPTP